MGKLEVVCNNCEEKVDITECKAGFFWDKDGKKDIYHICPKCGKPVEPLYEDEEE